MKKSGLGEIETPFKLRALYSLYPPLRFETEDSVEQYNRVLKDLGNGKRLVVQGSSFHDGAELIVIALPCTATQKTRFFKNAPLFGAGNTVLEFSGVFKFPGEERFFMSDHTGAKTADTEEELFSIWKSFLPDDVALTIQSYLSALMIAYSGSVRPHGNIWLLNEHPYKSNSYYVSQVHESVEFLRENRAFPKIEMDVDSVVNWTFKQNGIFNGYSDTPASRALNYFTRLFTSDFRSDELSDLVWALAGMEALLVEGGRSSVGQLREKLTAIFGSQVDSNWLAKMTTESYNYRSRMIHGDRQIRSFFRNDEDGSKKRFYEQYNSQLFSIGILTLLLQYVASNDLTELRFRTTLESAPEKRIGLIGGA